MSFPKSLPAASHDAYNAGAAALILALTTILGALAFEHIGGYPPCPLCLTQRWAYYAGSPLLFLALALLAAEQKRAAGVIFLAVGFAFFANGGLAAFHAGVELKYWPGPETCGGSTGALTPSAGELLKNLSTIRVVRCDEPALLIFGLSMAAWNVLVCLILFVLSIRAAFKSVDENRV